jgi:hypothetical protein
MPKPQRTARSIAVSVIYVAACIGATVTSIGAANYLLREGGIRALALGVASTFAAVVLIVGLLALYLGRGLRDRQWPFSADVVAIVLAVGGGIGLRAGLQAIDRVAPIDPVALAIGCVFAAITLAPVALFYMRGVAGLFMPW